MADVDKEGAGLPKAAIAAIVVVVILVVGFFVYRGKSTYEPVVAGTVAPDFTLPNLEGKPVKLSDFRGKVVFLNFWATWCKPCEEEMPSMQALYNELRAAPFVIVAVSVDSEGPEVIDAFAKKYGITFPILHDRSGKIKERYKTTGVPETFIVDQNGVIAEKVWGPRDWTAHGSVEVLLDLVKNGARPPESYKSKR